MSAKPAITFLTTSQAGKSLGVSAIRVRQLISEGRLLATKHGTDWLILATDLAAVKKRKTGRPRQGLR